MRQPYKYNSQQIQENPFHGDRYLIDLIDNISDNIDAFIETGTNIGASLSHYCKKHPNILALSCEPHKESFSKAQKNCNFFKNLRLYNCKSLDFMEIIFKTHKDLFDKRNLFWLDAHGHGFDWPLKEEVKFITEYFSSGFLFVDDFFVPGKDKIYLYGQDNNNICSYNYIVDDIKKNHVIYYPDYEERTSTLTPLIGWGLILFGNINWEVPDKIRRYIKLESGKSAP